MVFILLKNCYKKTKKVLILDTSEVKSNATYASVGMLAPLIEAKPYENELLELMIDSKKLWDKKLKENLIADVIGLKKICHYALLKIVMSLKKSNLKRFFKKIRLRNRDVK